MKGVKTRSVWSIYLSTAVLLAVFLPGLLDLDSGIGHAVEHALIVVAAAVFTFSIERLRQVSIGEEITAPVVVEEA